MSNLLDPRLVDSGSTLIHIGSYDPNGRILKANLRWSPTCAKKFCQFIASESMVIGYSLT